MVICLYSKIEILILKFIVNDGLILGNDLIIMY